MNQHVSRKQRLSFQTRKNWWIDFSLFTSALLATLTGIYFLFLPSNGYQGGRNSMAGIQILFSRSTWDDLHTWGGVAMIAIAAYHLAIHWHWVVNMTRRTIKEFSGQCGCMNRRGRFNLILNGVVALSFLLTALSSVYFLVFPGNHGAVTPQLILSRQAWDLIHTWAGVVLIVATLLHFAIHWKWVTKVTRDILPAQTGSLAGVVSNTTNFPTR